MKEKLALRLLSSIMGWSDERARDEFQWLRLMALLKYDGYRDFVAGMRFVESLASWIQQFPTREEREVAYAAVRERLVYIGPAEFERLVELLYPNRVRPRLVRAIAARAGIQPYQVWGDSAARGEFRRLLRRTLFMALSDGARLEAFRRVNTGLISNEQVVTAIQIDNEKWDDLLRDLREDLQDADARFAFVFLVDDFMGTGTTLIRERAGHWKGKLARFWESIDDKIDTHFAPDWVLCVHHYIGTDRANLTVRPKVDEARTRRGPEQWFPSVELTFETVLPADLPLQNGLDDGFIDLAGRYYDESLETSSTREGGTDMKLGFGHCALPLVLEHNTPNNSVSLLWAETQGKKGHAMRPLFRRKQRHVE